MAKFQKWIEAQGLTLLEGWSRDGLTDEQIAHNMGISTTTLYDWKNRFPSISEALKKGKEVVDYQVENALLKRALGYEYTEIMTEEMKDTASNRDVNSGGTGAGVTAASAIAALQEAGNKVSRDMISASYRAYAQVAAMCVELIRQFYDETRAFRITGETGSGYQFVDLNNAALKDQPMGVDAEGVPLFRRPVFDLKIRAQKKNPFSRMEQNERAKELYGLGFFNPERAQECLGALEMMDFEGKDKVVEYARQGQTLLNVCQQMAQQMDQMAMLLQAATGVNMGAGQVSPRQPSAGFNKGGIGQGQSADSVTGAVMQAQTPMTSYGERLAKRSTPSMEG